MEYPLQKKKQKESQKYPFQESFRSKTQKAIELINKHQSQKYNFLKTLNNSKKFINSSPTKSDQQYFSIIEIPEIFLQQSIKVQLLPYTDQVYKIKNPFAVFDEKVNQNESLIIDQEDDTSSQGTVPINNSQIIIKPTTHKTKPSPSFLNRSVFQNSRNQLLQTNCRIKIFIKNYRGASSELLIYFEDSSSVKDYNFHSHKFIISSEKIVNINMEEFLNKSWIYFRIKTRSELSMFAMRVEKQSNVRKRISTQAHNSNQFESINNKQRKLPKLNGSKSLNYLKKSQSDKPKTMKSSGSVILKPMVISTSLQKLNNDLSPSSKKKNKQILEKLRKQQIQKKKQEQEQKHQQVLQKKTAIEVVKQKQLKLRSKALQMKRLVEQYKVFHQDEQYYRKFLLPKLAVLLILPRFNKICHEMIVCRQNGMQMAKKTRSLTKKFTKIVKNKYKQSIEHIKNRKNRELVGVVNFTTLFAKFLYKNCTEQSSKIIMATINLTKPGQLINHCFDKATDFRRSVRYIQKTWLILYKARMTMFEMYVKDQAQSLIGKYPYFKYVHAKFLTDNVPKNLAYKYMADQSSKLKYLFEDYKQKLQEIKQFKEMNNKIIEFNKTALKKRQKALLEVPKTPCRPSLRYFRNISFLKSMIRGWFEIEYRKWCKVNKVKQQNVIGQNNKGEGSPRKPIKVDASINSVDLSSGRKQ